MSRLVIAHQARIRRAVELQSLESRILFSVPTASFPAAPGFTAGASNFAVTVQYTDAVPFNPATISPANLAVSGAKVGALQVTGDVVSVQGPDSLSVTYYVNAPNQIFDQRANDTYTITVQPNSVFDSQGIAAGSTSTTMTANLSPISAPVAVASAPSFLFVEAAGTTGETLEVTYSDTVPITLSSIGSANLSGGGLDVQLLSATSQDGGTVVHAIYQLAAPKGALFPSDDTGYHVALIPSGPGAVVDSNGNGFPSNVLALYEVEINPFSPTFDFADTTSPLFVPEASAHQSNGKLIVAGHVGDTTTGQSQVEIERFNSNGSLDATFGNNGIVLGPAGNNEAAFALQMLPGDAFLISGTSQKQLLMQRYTANGALDTSFGSNATGTVTTTIIGFAAIEMADTIALSPDGSIVIAGQSDGSWAFAKFSSDGVLANSFLFQLPSGNDGTVGALAVQTNGMIVAAGSDGSQVDLGRFSTTGTLDPAFNDGSIETLSSLSPRQNLGYLDHNMGLGIDAGGKILVAATTSSSPNRFATERLLPGGSPDTSFGSSGTGVVTTSFSGNADAQQVTFPGNGLILVSGVNVDSGGSHPISITYNPNGTLFTGVTPPPAVSISGTVFNGQSGAPQGGVTVFLDSNHDGILDNGETSTTTNGSGTYIFANAAAGSYAVDEVAPGGFVSQTPEASVDVSNTSVSGPNFENLPSPVSAGSPGPDLVAAFASAVPTAVVGGAAGQLTLHLSNIGQNMASGVIQIALLATSNGTITGGDVPFATISTRVKLQAGKSTNLKLKFKFPSNLTGGNYFIAAAVDSTNVIAETNETNNVAVSSAQVGIGLPFVTIGGTMGVPGSLKAGKQSSATLSLNNSGNVTATGVVKVSFFASASQTLDQSAVAIGSTSLRVRLLPGRSGRYRLRLAVPKGFATGSKFVLAKLDASAITGVTDGSLVIPAGSASIIS
jgi:uncharacterized delta-60 repeat protein